MRGGTGRDYDQQEFTNKIQQDTLIAKQELNKINSVNVLQNRLTQVNAEIAALQAQLSDTPTNQALRKADAELQEAIEDGKDTTKIQKRVKIVTKCFKEVPEGFYRLPKMAKQAQEGQKWARRPPKTGKMVPRKGSRRLPGGPWTAQGTPRGPPK